MSFFTELLYGFPSRKAKFIFLTGPEGKTTVAKLTQHILSHLNINSSLYQKKYNLTKFVSHQLRQNIKYIISEYPFKTKNSITVNINLNTPPEKLAKKIKISPTQLSFDYKNYHFITDSPFYYLINTIIAAFEICLKLNIKPEDFIKNIQYFPEILGQREEISNNFKFKTFLDSAQTPLAINAILTSLDKLPHNKLIVIFGYSSLRDNSLRKKIGEILSKFADKIYFTSDDMVKEPIEKIAADVFGDNNNKKLTIVSNRQDAFNEAIKTATTDDIIIALGRGRRNYLIQNNTRFPWSEAEAFRTAFRIRNQ